jgi:phosphonate transport system ATP-binding protein
VTAAAATALAATSGTRDLARPATAVAPLAVRATGIVKGFGSGARVIDGLDLDIAAGTAVSLIGANGTGKSTLVRMFVRLVEPDAGDIQVLGTSVRGLGARDLKALRARVGFVFQKHNLVARLSALSNVVHGVQSRRSGPRTWHQALAPAEVRDEAMDCLDRVGLAHKAKSRVDTLSGGQAQRVAIARMLMQRPELVIADEPDASLDPKSGEDVMALLLSLARDRGATLVVVSHRMEHATRFADRIVGLAGGRVALDRPASGADPHALGAFFHDA